MTADGESDEDVTRHRDGFWLKAALAVGVVLAFSRFLQAASGAGGGSLDQMKLSSKSTSHPSRRRACAYCM